MMKNRAESVPALNIGRALYSRLLSLTISVWLFIR